MNTKTRPTSQELAAIVALHYATQRPALARGFAEFVLKQGYGAKIPELDNGRKVRFAGRTWQWLGKEIYGEDFVTALKELIEERKRKADSVDGGGK